MKGRIIKWDDEKGFGFIKSTEASENIFVHASNFVDKRLRPAIGDDVSFELQQTSKGLQAKRVSYPNQPTDFTPSQRISHTASSSSILATIFKLVLLAAVLFGGYHAYHKYQSNKVMDDLAKPVYLDNGVQAESKPIATTFSCDGRQHCSQMNSREEAEYFIKHCPDTKMDGDNDGVPCENDARW